ncbi:Hypothetical protein Minf_2446 [Methylacidiphilum infernorum V4]|uniref:Uncharacterized protein n=1 Tax=Methylacidiphilum infernorum (isolate V4) TaxID=481448 RepID=B3E123_METI4|nr:Hypothetical protein Minf_2446 [Methylacidiphilum infernorum V4]
MSLINRTVQLIEETPRRKKRISLVARVAFSKEKTKPEDWKKSVLMKAIQEKRITWIKNTFFLERRKLKVNFSQGARRPLCSLIIG